VKIVVSGGIDEKEILELRNLVDAFGVGTSIANPPNIDISADIVEIHENNEWRPITKRGKLPGAKQVYRRRPGLNDIVTLLDKPGEIQEEYQPLLRKYMENGELLVNLPSLSEIREYVLEQLRELPEPMPM
jgi:nicotinate phosphoribosyltransferase